MAEARHAETIDHMMAGLDVCAALREVQERYFSDGEWLDPDEWAAQPLYRQVGWNLARMFNSVL